ncbi:hypothetical protein KCU77_g13493, partial [Aureobasidium melanogenum]
MASSQSTDGLSQQMEKMSVSGKRHADTPRYTPPHRKYAQANKSVETSTAAPAKDANNRPAVSRTTSEKSIKSDVIASTEPKTSMETRTTPAPAPSKESVAEPKPKIESRSMAHNRKHSKPATEVADSWEEEASLDQEPASTTTNHTAKQTPEPASVPQSSYVPPHLKYRSAAPSPPSRSLTPPSRSTTPSSSTFSERRPEKTNAVAHRLIAGALGVKVPRRTEEQRAYDKAMREQEKRKRDKEREAKKKAEEDAAKAKAAIWDD